MHMRGNTATGGGGARLVLTTLHTSNDEITRNSQLFGTLSVGRESLKTATISTEREDSARKMIVTPATPGRSNLVSSVGSRTQRQEVELEVKSGLFDISEPAGALNQ